MLLGLGIVTGIVAQALFNISVTLSLVPTKGIPLPFISYGGSSLVPTLFAVGVLLNISQQATARGSLAATRTTYNEDATAVPTSPRRRAVAGGSRPAPPQPATGSRVPQRWPVRQVRG
jgi:cell division protein FtsW